MLETRSVDVRLVRPSWSRKKMAALVNSGSRRDQPRPESLQSKKIGCMSGLFQLLHSSPRKRITSARREAETKKPAEYNVSTRKNKLPKTTTSRHKSQATLQGGQARTIRLPGNIVGGDITPPMDRRIQQHHISCNAPRSPTLAPQLRRSNSVDYPCRPEAAQSCVRRSPVAKLMGLDDIHSTTPAAAAPPMEKEAAAEKRRKLLGALEKCDEDLQALKKIIEAIKKAEMSSTHATGNGKDHAAVISSTNCESRSYHSMADDQVDDKDARHNNPMDMKATHGQQITRLEYCSGLRTTSETGKCMGETKKQWEDGAIIITTYGGYDQQPSPVSVLDGSTHLLFSSPQVLLSSPPIKVGDHDYKRSKKMAKDNSFLERINIVAQAPPALLAPRRRGEPLVVAACRRSPVRPSGSKAMRETVNEVWMEGVWGQGWELGRVGVMVESDIFGELVAELVKELDYSCSTQLVTRIKHYKPPFEVCKKRLSF